MSECHQYNLVCLISGLYAQYKYAARRYSIGLNFECADAFYINFDKEEIQRVLICLLDNAIPFTPQGGSVTLSLGNASGNKLCINIICNPRTDVTPIPLNMDRQIVHIKDILERHKSDLFPSFAYVGRAMRSMEGEFEIIETDQGGIIYQICLPLGADKTQTHKNQPNNAYSNDALLADKDSVSVPIKNKKTILILIADPDLNDYVNHELSGKYKIIQVTNEFDARGVINKSEPDFVILEYQLRWIMEEFAEYPLLKSIPTLTLVDSDEEGLHSNELSNQWYNVILKLPVTSRFLSQEVDNLLSQHISTVDYLKESERRYKTLFDNSPELIVVHDNEKILFANKSALKLFGASSQRAIVKKQIFDLIAPEFHSRFRKHIKKMLKTKKVSQLNDIEVKTLNGKNSLYVDAISIPLEINNQYYIHTLLHYISERKILERAVIETSTAEQIRIGSEIHDRIGQELTTISMLLKNLADKYDQGEKPESFKKRLQHIQQIACNATHSARLIAKGLSPIEFEGIDIAEALTQLIHDIVDDTHIGCSLSIDAPQFVIDSTTSLHLYRITQEAANNAIKHSRAKHLTVRLFNNVSRLTLSIVDDGIGFEASDTQNPYSGIGLKLMRYRADILGANLRILSRPGEGTRIEVNHSLT